MLQWMGGSRRKVAASHTSVKKRQKQYFEQKRRQQNQFTAGSGSCSNERNAGVQRQSLDILNFINLSTPATPKCKPSPPEDEKFEDLDAGFSSLKDNISGVGSSFNNKAETISSKRISSSLPYNQTKDVKKANPTVNLMDGPERKLSVFDLVGDDHTTTNLEERSPSEPHMAFSVEGLGKISTETPPSSPQSSSRNFAYGCSSPWNDSGKPTSNVRERLSDFEKEVDISIESSKLFQDNKRYRSPIDIHATYGGRTQKLRTSTDHLHKPYISDSRGYFCDTADFNKNKFFDENEWNAKPTFLDDGVGRFYWKDQQPRQEESLNLNFNNYGRDYAEGRSSAEHHDTKNRDYQTTWRSNIEGSPIRRPQRPERTVDHPSFYKETTLDFNFDKVFDPPVRSSVVLEEDKDSHSLRSEESCSSSAVRANETSISHIGTHARQRKREADSFCNIGDKSYLNKGLFQESWEDWDVDDQQLKRKVGSGKQVRLSNPGKLKSNRQRDSDSPFCGGLDAPYNWFAEGFTAAGISSDITTERDKPYDFVNRDVGSSHWRQSRAPDSLPETWVPKFSAEGTGYDDEYDYVNCVSANHKSKLAGDICSFGSEALSEDDNEQSNGVNDPKNQGDETSSSVAKSLSDENEYVRCNHPNKEVMKARHQGNRESRGEKTSRDSFQQMIMLERRTLKLVCLNKTLLLDSLKTR